VILGLPLPRRNRVLVHPGAGLVTAVTDQGNDARLQCVKYPSVPEDVAEVRLTGRRETTAGQAEETGVPQVTIVRQHTPANSDSRVSPSLSSVWHYSPLSPFSSSLLGWYQYLCLHLGTFHPVPMYQRFERRPIRLSQPVSVKHPTFQDQDSEGPDVTVLTLRLCLVRKTKSPGCKGSDVTHPIVISCHLSLSGLG